MYYFGIISYILKKPARSCEIVKKIMLLLDSPAEQTAKVEHFRLLLYISHVLTIILLEEQNILPQKSVDEKLGGGLPLQLLVILRATYLTVHLHCIDKLGSYWESQGNTRIGTSGPHPPPPLPGGNLPALWF